MGLPVPECNGLSSTAVASAQYIQSDHTVDAEAQQGTG